MKNKIEPIDGSYLAHLGQLVVTDAFLRSQPQRPCPVCCRHCARDREMIVIRVRGSRFWVCKSAWEDDNPCGFAFPRGMREDRVRTLGQERAKHMSLRTAH